MKRTCLSGLIALGCLAACVGDAPVASTSDSGVGPDTGSGADGGIDTGTSDGGADTSAPDAGPPAATGKTLWLKTFPGADIAAVATDGAGNTYATGSFYGSQVDFGGGKKLTSTKGADAFIVKVDPAGTVLWAASIGGTGGSLNINDEYSRGIAVDPAGDVYISGSTDSGTITVGANSATMTPGGNIMGFAAKLSGVDGTGKWVVAFSTANNGISMTCDGIAAAGSVVAVGCVLDGSSLVWTGGGPLLNQDNPNNFVTDMAVIGLDPTTHATLWANGIGEKGTSDGVSRLAIDKSGDVLVAGRLGPSTASGYVNDTLGSITIPRPANAHRDAFFAKLAASNGKQVWSKLFASGTDLSSSAVASDPNSALVMLGGSFSSADFGTGLLTAAGNNDAYVLGFDATTKTTQFAKTIGGGATGQYSYESTSAIVVDAWSQIIAVGTHQSTDSKADGKPILGPPANDYTASFIVKYAPGGVVLWAKGLASGSAADDVTVTSVAVTPTGELRVGGHWKGTAALDGSTPITSVGNSQSFLLALSP